MNTQLVYFLLVVLLVAILVLVYRKKIEIVVRSVFGFLQIKAENLASTKGRDEASIDLSMTGKEVAAGEVTGLESPASDQGATVTVGVSLRARDKAEVDTIIGIKRTEEVQDK